MSEQTMITTPKSLCFALPIRNVAWCAMFLLLGGCAVGPKYRVCNHSTTFPLQA